MKKKLLVIISTDNKDMIKFALNFTYNVKTDKTLEDVKLFFFGTSEKEISQNEQLQMQFIKIVKEGDFIPVACINVANNYNIKDKLESLGFKLTQIGEDISESINSGYIPLTF